MTRSVVLLTACSCAALVAGCALRPSAVRADRPLVMVKSVRLPDRSWLPWYTRFAEHLWVDFHCARTWHRVEWDDIDHIRMRELSETEVFADERWQRDVAVHATFDGERGEHIASRILTAAADYPCRHNYRAWPGPNSNTFVGWLAHEVEMPLVMPPAAVGKDFTTWLHVGTTTSGSGVELETLPLGVELGLCEGVEVHLLGLTTGVSLWPPALKLPFLPAFPGGWFAP